MAKQHSRAFTLVELLVVISIIGMLTAIVLPAVNQSIRAARRTQCMNNQKQIALAIIAYTSAKDRFPGYVHNYPDPDDASVSPIQSWVVELLPRLDHGDVYDQWHNIAAVDRPRLGVLLCPEDEQETLGGAALSYIANCGVTGGLPADDSRYSGIFHDHTVSPKVTIKLDDFRDGTSSTLLLSESYKASRYDATAEFLLGFLWNSGMTDDARVINIAVDENAAGAAGEARINSHHVGGANAIFADGSAQFLSEKIAAHVYAKLCTPSGGRLATPQTGVISEEDLNP